MLTNLLTLLPGSGNRGLKVVDLHPVVVFCGNLASREKARASGLSGIRRERPMRDVPGEGRDT